MVESSPDAPCGASAREERYGPAGAQAATGGTLAHTVRDGHLVIEANGVDLGYGRGARVSEALRNALAGHPDLGPIFWADEAKPDGERGYTFLRGYLYLVEFDTGDGPRVKPGATQAPLARISRHIKYWHKYGWRISRIWVSPAHLGTDATERALAWAIRQAGGRAETGSPGRGGNGESEVLSGVGFDRCVDLAYGLALEPVTEAGLNRRIARVDTARVRDWHLPRVRRALWECRTLDSYCRALPDGRRGVADADITDNGDGSGGFDRVEHPDGTAFWRTLNLEVNAYKRRLATPEGLRRLLAENGFDPADGMPLSPDARAPLAVRTLVRDHLDAARRWLGAGRTLEKYCAALPDDLRPASPPADSRPDDTRTPPPVDTNHEVDEANRQLSTPDNLRRLLLHNGIAPTPARRAALRAAGRRLAAWPGRLRELIGGPPPP